MLTPSPDKALPEPLPPINGMTFAEIAKMCLQHGGRIVHAEQLYRGVMRQAFCDFAAIPNLPQALREHLQRHARVLSLMPAACRQGKDGTRKLLFRLHDGRTIESVLIPARGRLTLCISTQAGCAMGCRFCLTAKDGLNRNLTVAEMVAQVQAARAFGPVRNLVLMGMGEPLHNYDAVARFVRIAADARGLAFAPRRITVSTVGIVPGIQRMAADKLPCNLAVSLNATTDELRSRIMPINRRYPLAMLVQAMHEYALRTGRRVLVAYVLLAGINDTDDDARRLAALLAGLPCTINLLPLNVYPGSPFRRPTDARISAFRKHLIDAGYVAVVRESRGQDILAACGQLHQERK